MLSILGLLANTTAHVQAQEQYEVLVTEKGARLLIPVNAAPRNNSDDGNEVSPVAVESRSSAGSTPRLGSGGNEYISWAVKSVALQNQSAAKTKLKPSAAQAKPVQVDSAPVTRPKAKAPPVKQGGQDQLAPVAELRQTTAPKKLLQADFPKEQSFQAKSLQGGQPPKVGLLKRISQNKSSAQKPLIDADLVGQVDKQSRIRSSHVEEAVADIAQKSTAESGARSLPTRRYRIPSSGESVAEPRGGGLDPREGPRPFPISIEFANVPLELAVQMLSSIIGVDILLGTEVEGTLNLALYDVPWDVAIDTILSVEGLAQYKDERANVIRWHEPKRLETLLEEQRKRAEEIARRIRAESADLPTHTEIFQLFYTDPKDVGDQLRDIFGSSLDTGAQSGPGLVAAAETEKSIEITVNEKQNLLIVKGYAHQLDLVAELIDKIDARTKQVMIEAFIVEVSDDFERQLGSRLSLDADVTGNRAAGTLSGVANTPGLSLSDNSGTLYNLSAPGANTAIGALFDSNRLKIELSALEQEGYSKTISNPRLLAFDNEEATIFQGSEVPYSTTSNEGTQTEFKEAGLKLSVTPSVVGDGTLIIDVTVNQDTVETNRDNPPITKREISTRLLVRDGGAAILGGIFLHSESNAKRSVPILGDIPLVGRLFSSRENRDDRRELLIFIVPTIL